MRKQQNVLCDQEISQYNKCSLLMLGNKKFK